MTNNEQAESTPVIQTFVAILWPSFLLSGIGSVLFFAAFDPIDMLECNGYPDPSRLGAYTVGFFLLWLLMSASNLLALYFKRPCPAIPRPDSGGE